MAEPSTVTHNAVDWSRADTVLFDMDGTLLDLHFDTYFWTRFLPEHVAAVRNISIDSCKDDLFAHMHERAGTLEWYDTAYWSSHLAVDVIALKHEAASRIAIRPGSVALLNALKQADKRIMLVTNADRRVMDLKFSRTRIDAHFDTIVSSHDFGHPKEAAEFWQSLVRTTQIHAQRCVLIDDSVGVLRAAHAFGIGQVVAPLTPDSQGGPRRDHEFATIARFDDIHPV